jgi:hypothetical protein
MEFSQLENVKQYYWAYVEESKVTKKKKYQCKCREHKFDLDYHQEYSEYTIDILLDTLESDWATDNPERGGPSNSCKQKQQKPNCTDAQTSEIQYREATDVILRDEQKLVVMLDQTVHNNRQLRKTYKSSDFATSATQSVKIPLTYKGSTLNDGSLQFSLMGVIYHMGGNTGGHYVAKIKGNKNNEWFLCNDEDVTSTNSHMHDEPAIPILRFYTREDLKETDYTPEGIKNPSDICWLTASIQIFRALKRIIFNVENKTAAALGSSAALPSGSPDDGSAASESSAGILSLINSFFKFRVTPTTT